jgi:hypothetical protein
MVAARLDWLTGSFYKRIINSSFPISQLGGAYILDPKEH